MGLVIYLVSLIIQMYNYVTGLVIIENKLISMQYTVSILTYNFIFTSVSKSIIK
jgi:hypothetical protein